MELESGVDDLSQIVQPLSRPQPQPSQEAEPATTAPKQPRRKSAGGESLTEGPAPEADASTKKCKRCKKNHPKSNFYEMQANCKDCSTALKSIQSIARRTGEAKWLRDLKEHELDGLVLSYRKEREKASKEQTRLKFSLVTYKERTVRSQGIRRENRRRMMTEEMFYMFAPTPAGGSLSKTQAQNKWADMLTDDGVVKEGEGRSLRCAVLVHDDLIDYSDHGDQKEIESQSKLSTKLTSDQMEAKKDTLLWGGDFSGSAGSSAGKRKFEAVLASSRPGSEELPGLAVTALSDLHKPKQRKDVEQECGESGSEAEEGTPEKPISDTKPQKRDKWFDAVAQRAKAGRQFDNSMSKHRAKMAAQLESMKEMLNKARTAAAANAEVASGIVLELKILTSRREALTIIHGQDSFAYKGYVEKVRSCDDAKSVNTHGSANEGLLLNTGPCHDFENLYTMSQAVEIKNEIEAARSQDDLDLLWKRVRNILAHWDELLASCKTAVTEVKKAVESKDNTSAKAKAKSKAKSKPKAKASGSAAAGKGAVEPMYQAFSAKGREIEVFKQCPIPADHAMSEPFILQGLPDFLAHLFKWDRNAAGVAEILTEVEDFQKKFGSSDLRFTAGKGQRPMQELNGQKVLSAMGSILEKHELLDVEKWQQPSVFTTVKGHQSFQFEVGGFPCLRFCLEGDRDLLLVYPSAVLSVLDEQNQKRKEEDRDRITFASTLQFMSTASQHDLDGLLAAGAMWVGKLTPGSILYTPGGMIAGEKIPDSVDHMGLKVACFPVHPQFGDLKGIEILRKMQNESRELGRKSESLNSLLTAVDNKQSDLKAALEKASNKAPAHAEESKAAEETAGLEAPKENVP